MCSYTVRKKKKNQDAEECLLIQENVHNVLASTSRRRPQRELEAARLLSPSWTHAF